MEPSFCLELEDDDYPRTETEYMSLLHAKIAEAHERQLLPLKEDLADWLSKLLGADDLTADNLIDKLENGVYICKLAEVISRRAQDARDKGISTLEVPRLPYRTWDRARSGTFFARDNISNFLRFCRRLGVHDNLLFETEDLVCHTGARGVVLCLLEVGRLAQGWWGLEPPGIVKLEREMDGEEWSGRSDSGYSNTSSPRGSTLTLHPTVSSPPAADPAKLPRPLSAPGHLQLVPRLVLPNQSTHTQTETPPSSSKTSKSSSPRPEKPTPPPKPASIRRAVSNLARRPTRIPTKTRGWSGAKTTPTTPVTTPTHSAKPRLPSARTPRSSGRSTPNTTPTTPTHCRKYISTFQQRTPVTTPVRPSQSRPTSRPSSKPPSRSPSICSRLQECYNTVQPESVTAALRTDLDNKVLDIANESRGFCGCKNVDCRKPHVKRVSDGKYEICGRNVFVRQKSTGRENSNVRPDEPDASKGISQLPPFQPKTPKKSALKSCSSTSSHRKVHFPTQPDLLKGKHVMVRVGGGWDTLEHYLLRHDPQQVTVFNLKSADPFLHIRAKYCSPTQSQASSSKGSPTRSRATPSRGTASGDPTPGNSSSEGTPPPFQEPQVPSSSPAVSSNHGTGNSVPTTDSSMPNHAKDLPHGEHITTDESAVTKDSVKDTIHHSTTEHTQPTEILPDSETTSSPTSTPRQMVNSTTFCIESNEAGEGLLKTFNSDLSPSSSSSSESSCSIKGTPPPTSSTMSTHACATSNPQDLSLTPNGSSTSVGTPLPHDSTDHDDI